VNASLLLSVTFVIKVLLLGRFTTDWSKEYFHVHEEILFYPVALSSAYFPVLKQTLGGFEMR
jgi:hypothetical protein